MIKKVLNFIIKKEWFIYTDLFKYFTGSIIKIRTKFFLQFLNVFSPCYWDFFLTLTHTQINKTY